MDNIGIIIKSLLRPVSDAEINKFKKELQNKIGNVNIGGTKGVKLLNQEEIDIYIKRLQNSLSRMQFKTPKVFDNAQVKEEIDKLTIEFNKLRNNATSIKQVGLQFDNLKTKVTQVSSSLRNTNKDGYNFIQMLELAGKKIAIWGISTQLIYGTWRAIKSGLDVLKELDDLMVDIAKVTNLSADAFDRLKKSSFDAASAYGRTAQDYLKSIAEFSRAGYDEQAEGLSKLSLLSQNVGELTAEQANSFLLATDAAYKYAGSQQALGKVLDGVNQIDNRFATSIQKVSEGITVAGSIASNASVDVSELSAAVGTMTAVTQKSGNEAGRAFRSILMNIRQIKGETEDGEIIDDEAISKSAKALDSVGIKVHELKNGIEVLRNPMEVLNDLANVWESLGEGSLKQSQIIEAIGGKYRGNQLVALLENWTIYEKMLAEYAGAAGSAMAENEKRMSSWQTKLNQLSNELANIFNNAVSTDFVKSLLDISIAIVKVIDKIGLLTIAIPTAILAFSFFNKGFLTFITNIVPQFLQSIGLIVAAENGVAIAANGAAISTKALSVAFATLAPFAIITGIVLLTKAFDALNITMEEYQQQVNDSYNTTQSNIARIKELGAEYETLARKTSLTSDEKIKLVDIEHELNLKFGATTESIDLQNGSLETNIKKIDELTKKEAERFKTLNQRAYNEANKTLDNPYFLELSDNFGIKYDSIQDAIIAAEEALAEATDKSNVTYEARKKILEDLYKKYDDAIDIVSKYEGYESLLGNTTDDTSENLDTQVNKIEEITSRINGYKTEVKTAFDELEKSSTSLSSAYDELSDSNEISIETARNLLDTYPELASAMNIENGHIKLNKKVLEDLWQIEKDRHIKKLEDTKKQLEEQSKALNNTIEGYSKEGQSLVKLMEIEQARFDQQKELAGQTSVYAQQKVDELNKKKTERPSSFSSIDEGLLDFWTGALNQFSDEANAQSSAALDKLKEAQDLVNEINAINKEIDIYKSTSIDDYSKKSSSGSKTELYTAEINQFQAYEDALADINIQLEKNEALQKLANNQDQITLLNKRIELLKKEQEALHILTEERRKAISSNVSKLQVQGFDVSYDAATNQLAIRNWQHINDLKGKNTEETNKLRKATEDLLDESVKMNEANQDASKEWYTVQSNINDTTNAITKLYEQIKEARVSLEDDVRQALEDKYDKQIDDYKKLVDKEKELIKDRYDTEIDSISRLKELNSRNYDEQQYVADQKERYEKLAKLQERYRKISFDTSRDGQKEQFELETEISELRKDIQDAEVERNLKVQSNQYDDQIDLLQRKKDEETDALEKSLEEQNDIWADKQDEIVKQSYKNYWEAKQGLLNISNEINNIMNGSQTSILQFLMENSKKFLEAGKEQGQQFINGWKEKLNLLQMEQNLAQTLVLSLLDNLKNKYQELGNTQGATYVQTLIDQIKSGKLQVNAEMLDLVNNLDKMMKVIDLKMQYAVAKTQAQKDAIEKQANDIRSSLPSDLAAMIGSNVTLDQALQNIQNSLVSVLASGSSGGGNGSSSSSNSNLNNSSQSTIDKMKQNSQDWFNASPEEKQKLATDNLILGKNMGLTRDPQTGIWYKPDGTRAYAKGTLNAEAGLAQLNEGNLGYNGTELRVLNKGDGIINAQMTKNLVDFAKIAPTILPNFSTPKMPDFSIPKNSGISSQQFEIKVNLGGVSIKSDMDAQRVGEQIGVGIKNKLGWLGKPVTPRGR